MIYNISSPRWGLIGNRLQCATISIAPNGANKNPVRHALMVEKKQQITTQCRQARPYGRNKTTNNNPAPLGRPHGKKTMLDQDTKRRIDTARDILVGKLPNPQAQVEQITIAMIYKFMDDMDKEAMEFGGKATFFTDDYEKYSWTKIFDPKLGGFEMLGLYGEAIVKLNQNPNIPQLFRDIFKNAFLPYRDPETLKMFLKVINEFHYDHSETLGDAFEYLLSVLGSQGDAGQFRTPRHIIDFMVELMQPKKNETILDPACGTAGFLISSYKHIINENTKKSKGDLLTPDDRRKLIPNFTGYDISAEMVRLSLVNMYLHGFPTPHIYEYDTLTSEDRWGDYFDLVLANPPFMTPKGGIRPHKKFTLQANRSEVLFVDYIMEHINPTSGRAAIIVPEGIIFQSATAYKALRKTLIENNYLYGVVSLPAGIFQPYSGVKTSILLIDKSLAKKTDNILFVKIENDGYSLGAQRKEINQNDLPDAANLIKQYNAALRNNDFTGIDLDNLPSNALVVEKSKIAENGEFNLSGDRYTVIEKKRLDKYKTVSIGEISKILNGYAFKSEHYSEQGYRVIRITNVQKGFIVDDNPKFYPNEYENDIKNYILKKDDLLISLTGNVGRVGILPNELLPAALNQRVACIRPDETVNTKFLFCILNRDNFEDDCIASSNGIAQKNLSTTWLANYKIPLPPLSIQQEIVAKIEQYEKIIAGAKQVVENYKPQININPDWEMVELGKVCEVKRGRFSHRPRNAPEFYGGKYPFIQTGDIVKSQGGSIPYTQTLNELGLSVSKLFKPTIVLITIAANIGDTGILDYEACFTDSVVGLIPSKKVNPYFLELIMRTKKDYLNMVAPQAAQKNINVEILKPIKIPLPSLPEQEAIVAQIEKEQALVSANKELIAIYEQKIKDEIEKLWSE